MAVHWLIQAQDALQNSLGLENQSASSYSRRVEELGQMIERTFGSSATVLVVDCLQGYSSASGKQTLRLEVIENGESRARILKIGPPEILARELQGWLECSRPANDRGRVMMRLTAGSSRQDGQPETLIYEDAQQTLRAAKLVTLEEAVRQATRWGRPTTSSLEGVLDQLFVELADRLYMRCAPVPLCGAGADLPLARWLRTSLQKGVDAWLQPGTLAESCRQETLANLCGTPLEFFDPVEYLPRLFDAEKHLPRVLRGPAHGDLHGRNLLVGVVDGEARFPALFDYEDMGLNRLAGWDFAKLETELKVRALQEVFAGTEADFVQSVYHFERRLAEQTEQNNYQTEWPRSPDPESAEERLFCLMLYLRREARRCLESLQGRSRSWLHEYYFLLSVYGVYVGKFTSYRRRDAIAAFVAAGFAASRFATHKASGDNDQRQAEDRAAQCLLDNDPSVRPEPSVLSHRAALAFAREWARSRREPFVAAAVEILQGLRREFSCVAEIGQELALALMERSTLTSDQQYAEDASRLLWELDRQARARSLETLCRWGRWWKDRGDKLFDGQDPGQREMARKAYETARAYYQQAHDEFDRDYYPGINAATLHLLTASPVEAKRLAMAIIDDLKEGRHHAADQLIWVWATLGEAQLLLGQGVQAAEYYRRAITHPSCRPHHIEAMHAQAKRILRAQPCEGFASSEVFESQLP